MLLDANIIEYTMIQGLVDDIVDAVVYAEDYLCTGGTGCWLCAGSGSDTCFPRQGPHLCAWHVEQTNLTCPITSDTKYPKTETSP